MNKFEINLFLFIFLIFIQSCSSTGVKDFSKLSPPSSTEANIYLKRLSSFSLSGTRAIIKVNDRTFGSLFNNDFLKINLPPGNQTLIVAGDPMLGVYGRTDINLNLEAGESYYFLTGVRSDNGLAILLDGVIDQNAAGGPFTIRQVTKNSFAGIDMMENDNRPIISDEKNKVSEIKALHQLYKDKVLTKEEFEKEKRKILDR
tara:strand:+ start:901 stop:1506 length:606 start_codon:yes stop_codon:yes gene_type:complete